MVSPRLTFSRSAWMVNRHLMPRCTSSAHHADVSLNHKPELVIGLCSYDAAKYAMHHWHYTGTMPASKRLCFGVWEDHRFMGALVFSCGSGGATSGLALGLNKSFDLAELQRIALDGRHRVTVSRIVSITLKQLHRVCPGLK